MGEWVNRLIHAYNEILFRDLKNELSSQEKTKRNLKCILLQLKVLNTLWPIISLSEKGKTIAMIKESVAAKGSGEWGRLNRWSKEHLFCTILYSWIYDTIYLWKPTDLTAETENLNVWNFLNNHLDICGLLGWNVECDKTI